MLVEFPNARNTSAAIVAVEVLGEGSAPVLPLLPAFSSSFLYPPGGLTLSQFQVASTGAPGIWKLEFAAEIAPLRLQLR